MKYYKWIYSDEDQIDGIPGFVWISFEDAMAMAEEFASWGELGAGTSSLYEFEGVDPTKFPCSLSNTIMKIKSSDKLTRELFDEGMRYFASKSVDHFFSGESTRDDVKLFLDMANTVGCLVDSTDGRLRPSEGYYAHGSVMVKII